MVEFSFAYPFSLYNIYVGVKIGANLKAWSGFHHHHQEDLKKRNSMEKNVFSKYIHLSSTCHVFLYFFIS
jgi:hypothetical protein